MGVTDARVLKRLALEIMQKDAVTEEDRESRDLVL
jgi:hypothetical protein